MNDEIERAKLIVHIHEERPFIIKEVNQILNKLDSALPTHRLNQLITSLAWHERRRTPDKRLREFARELARLWKKVGATSTECHVYALLLNRLALTSELQALQQDFKEQLDPIHLEIDSIRDQRQRRERERSMRASIAIQKQEMQLYIEVAQEAQLQDDKRRWGSELLKPLQRQGQHSQIVLARLLLALTAISATETIIRSAELRQMIGEDALIWH